jgi:hypothetical protein
MGKTRRIPPPNLKFSKRYKREYIYWWDISPSLWAKFKKHYRIVMFIEGSRGRQHVVKTKDLEERLTKGNQTTRGRKGRRKGNWGIKILEYDPHTLRVEEPGKKPEEWEDIPEINGE